ncbi:MAG: SDR family oxidoreductase [Tildeniella nuda ZEHNDER 1965/U140]|jgi:uncharacterized protein YbjT (DUF2867 family)|nr:SDR family oxidoreductase [Tildeniella nuda ZEHNDER 1965/U140]
MVLVSGATGTNGSEIVRLLSAAGVPVRALVRSKAKATAIADLPGVELVEGDFDHPDSLEAALKGIDKAFMLPPFVNNMVELQHNFIEAAKRAGTKHIVKLSAFGADPNSPIVLGKWHGQSEKELEASGLAYTHLQPNGFLQNLLAFAQSIATQGTFFQPAADAKISNVDARDIAAVAAAVLKEDGHEGKTYVITGPEALSFSEVADVFTDVLGKKVTYVAISPEEFKASMLQWGQPEWLADALNELFGIYRAGYGAVVTNVVADVAKKTPITVEQFVRDHATAFQSA